MIVVDASVWASRFIPQDLHHVASREWLLQYMAGGNLVIGPALLPAEVAGAIARRTGAPADGHRAVARLLQLSTLRLLPIDRLLAEAAAHLAADLTLRGADAVYVATAHRLTVPLVTWDREQRERGGRLVTTRRPG
ncbi:MAG TPA: PIN domain-containing protein [Chloroflexota bacterium]|nr:PIN domain-containing protein [Chloroflexota bacterium]